MESTLDYIRYCAGCDCSLGFPVLYFGEEIVIQNPALRVIFRIGPWSFLAFTLLDILVTAAYGRREKRKKVRESSSSQPEAEETSAK